MARSGANVAAPKQIANIIASLNHFPSDANLGTLDEIIGKGELTQGVRDMVNAFANIEHSVSEEGSGAMEAIQVNTQKDK